jgi:transposase
LKVDLLRLFSSITGPRHREVEDMTNNGRRYSPKLKFQIVLEAITEDRTIDQIARAYGVHPPRVGSWKKVSREKAPEVFAWDDTVAKYERRIAELEQLLGRKEVEIALLKNFLGRRSWARRRRWS